MLTIKPLLVTAFLLLATGSTPGWAKDHSRQGHRVGFSLGLVINPFPSYYRPYYGFAGTYYPPYVYSAYRPYASTAYYPYSYRDYPEVVVNTVITTSPGMTYIPDFSNSNTSIYPSNQSETEPTVNSGDWYYCPNPDGFYPSIKICPSGWQRVAR